MRFSTATVAAIAAFLPALAVTDKTSRSFAVLHFNDGPLVTARMDPVVSPGETSAHLHSVQGGNAFAMDMPGDAATKATCSTSNIVNDKSNYWTPSLFFHNGNGSFIPVPFYYMNVYYFFEATDDEITAFPPGFRMVSGDPELRSAPSFGGGSNLDTAAGAIQPVQFTCPRQNYNSPSYNSNWVGVADPNNKGAGAGFPDQNCDGTYSPLRADIHFPSCYDPSAGPEAYKTNTQFPSSKGANYPKQNCPEGWIHTPHLFFEVYWNTPLFANEWTPGKGEQPFVLSNGDPTGFSLHGDFVNGWDTETLQTIIDTCDAGDSGMDKCPQIKGGTTYTGGCRIESPIEETITGTMDALPGCNPIQKGPAAASKMTCAGGSAAVVSAAASSAATSAASSPSETASADSDSETASSSSATATSSAAVVVNDAVNHNVAHTATTMRTMTKPALAAAAAYTNPVKVVTVPVTQTHTATHTAAASAAASKKTSHKHHKSHKHGHKHRTHKHKKSTKYARAIVPGSVNMA